jgi:hypothetical protein
MWLWGGLLMEDRLEGIRMNRGLCVIVLVGELLYEGLMNLG